MSLIDDLRVEVEKYATDFCKTEIVDFRLDPSDGMVLNTQETFYFKVKVTNDGSLDMQNVRVRANGTEYVDVATLSSSFGSQSTADPRTCLSGDSFKTGEFRGRATKATSGVKPVVTAQIVSWDASFNHILKDSSKAGAREGILRKEIMPTID